MSQPVCVTTVQPGQDLLQAVLNETGSVDVAPGAAGYDSTALSPFPLAFRSFCVLGVALDASAPLRPAFQLPPWLIPALPGGVLHGCCRLVSAPTNLTAITKAVAEQDTGSTLNAAR
jgi:hypothetical protein